MIVKILKNAKTAENIMINTDDNVIEFDVDGRIPCEEFLNADGTLCLPSKSNLIDHPEDDGRYAAYTDEAAMILRTQLKAWLKANPTTKLAA